MIGRSSHHVYRQRGGFPIRIDCTVEWEVLAGSKCRASWRNMAAAKKRGEESHRCARAHAIGPRQRASINGHPRFSWKERPRERFSGKALPQEADARCANPRTSPFTRRSSGGSISPRSILKPHPRQSRFGRGKTELTTKAKGSDRGNREPGGRRAAEDFKQEMEKGPGPLTKQTGGQLSIREVKKHPDPQPMQEIDKNESRIWQARLQTLDAEKTQLIGQTEAEVTKAAGNREEQPLQRLKMDCVPKTTKQTPSLR